MRTFTAAAALLAASLAACAPTPPDDFPAFVDSANIKSTSAAIQGYNLDTPIEVLAENPAAASVVDKNIPGLLEDPSYPIFKDMSLNLVASLSRGQISKQMLAQTATALAALPVTVPHTTVRKT
jgi:hypothetical protein